MKRVPVQSDMLRWARERAGMDAEALLKRFPKIDEWEAGARQPTLKQLESFADAVHVPIGYLFLPAPPDEPLPIPDFRTLAGRHIARPSPDLLDTIYACQERQGWYREFAQLTRQPPLAFIGSATTTAAPEKVAANMRATLGFDLDQRRDCVNWSEALRLFIDQADSAGVLVMTNGVVLNNTHRPLDIEEFRGFALADPLAPLVFINGTDSKSGQMFTLAHELAHLWLGASALSDASAAPINGYRREEVWCNQVAAEFLVPLAVLRTELRKDEELNSAVARLVRRFKVSTLVILRRLLDAGWLDRDEFDAGWQAQMEHLRKIERAGSGGDFYRTAEKRVSHRFAQALVESTLEGQTLYRDAFRMLGISKTETFNEMGRRLGVLL